MPRGPFGKGRDNLVYAMTLVTGGGLCGLRAALDTHTKDVVAQGATALIRKVEVAGPYRRPVFGVAPGNGVGTTLELARPSAMPGGGGGRLGLGGVLAIGLASGFRRAT